jgi:UDP-N-acetylmuramate--alanine ligase
MADALAALAQAGDVVLTVGAGDVTRVGPELLARLASRASPREADRHA